MTDELTGVCNLGSLVIDNKTANKSSPNLNKFFSSLNNTFSYKTIKVYEEIARAEDKATFMTITDEVDRARDYRYTNICKEVLAGCTTGINAPTTVTSTKPSYWVSYGDPVATSSTWCLSSSQTANLQEWRPSLAPQAQPDAVVVNAGPDEPYTLSTTQKAAVIDCLLSDAHDSLPLEVEGGVLAGMDEDEAAETYNAARQAVREFIRQCRDAMMVNIQWGDND